MPWPSSATRWGIPFLAAVPIAGLIAGVVGIIFGLPSLRIKGFYLIMATVAAYFIIHWLVLQFRGLTGGTEGLPVPPADIFGWSSGPRSSTSMWCWCWPCWPP